uniref:Uncharacterized protein n=1 Tax=Magallana gigas TaxID=29159 RepID=A0A8W8I5Y6_MAGGI
MLSQSMFITILKICEETFLPSGKIYTLCSPDRDHVVFRGLQSDLLYGVRVIGLNKSEKLPSERSWQLVDFQTFTLEEPIEIVNSTSSTKKPNENRNEILAIVAGVFSVVLACCSPPIGEGDAHCYYPNSCCRQVGNSP